MNIWLITNLSSSAATVQVIESWGKAGHHVSHLVPSSFHFNASATSLEEVYLGPKLPSPDFCFIRMGSGASQEAFALPCLIQSFGIPCVNNPEVLVRLRDKPYAMSKLALSGVPTPRTLCIGEQPPLEEIISRLGKPPWILKTRSGLKGLGVALVESERSFSSVLDTLLQNHTQVIVQEFIAERAGSDIRAVVMFGEVVAAMQRSTNKSEEFRSNLYLGGSSQLVELSEETKALAVKAAQSLELEVAGVDLIGSEDNLRVVEVNTSPGLAGISKAVKRDVSLDLLELLVAKYR